MIVSFGTSLVPPRYGAVLFFYFYASILGTKAEVLTAAAVHTTPRVPFHSPAESRSISPKNPRIPFTRKSLYLGERPPSLLKQHTTNVEYDCNGDGRHDPESECGAWDYAHFRCKNSASNCQYAYKFGDWTLDQSCRCKFCATQKNAFGDDNLRNPSAEQNTEVSRSTLFWDVFRGWGGAPTPDTCAPWVMPKSDADVANLLAYAKSKNYTVRISGAGHSAPGIVTDGLDDHVFVTSLGTYTAPEEYNFQLNESDTDCGEPGSFVGDTLNTPNKGTCITAWFNAGFSLFNVASLIRPHNLFTAANPAGYFFQVGGVIANSVHGPGYDNGFLFETVLAMRVMDASGKIHLVTSEKDLRYWRHSYGLLGIILAVKFKLEKRNGMHMTSIEKEFDWSEQSFWDFVLKTAEAGVTATDLGLTESIIKEVDLRGRGETSFAGHYFCDYITSSDENPTAKCLVYQQKKNEFADVDKNAKTDGIPPSVDENYKAIGQKKVRASEFQENLQIPFETAARRDGAPPVMILGIDVHDLLSTFKIFPLAKLLVGAALGQIAADVKDMNLKTNDGYYLTGAPAVPFAAWYLKPEKAFQAFSAVRKAHRDSRSDPDFTFSLPSEFRIIQTADTAILQPIPAGRWVNTELLTFSSLSKSDLGWKRAYAKLEKYFVDELGGVPHMGKMYGFKDHGTKVDLFDEQFTRCKIYSSAQKQAFQAYRQKWDPEGLFYQGQGTKLLKECRGDD